MWYKEGIWSSNQTGYLIEVRRVGLLLLQKRLGLAFEPLAPLRKALVRLVRLLLVLSLLLATRKHVPMLLRKVVERSRGARDLLLQAATAKASVLALREGPTALRGSIEAAHARDEACDDGVEPTGGFQRGAYSLQGVELVGRLHVSLAGRNERTTQPQCANATSNRHGCARPGTTRGQARVCLSRAPTSELCPPLGVAAPVPSMADPTLAEFACIYKLAGA